jgi:hypothetical protein
LEGRSDETDEDGNPVRNGSTRPRLNKASVFDVNAPAKKPVAPKPTA